MTTTEVLEDLRDRLQRATTMLEKTAYETGHATEEHRIREQRLLDKALGIRLARSYVDDTLRILK